MVVATANGYRLGKKSPALWLLVSLGILLVTCLSAWFDIPVSSPILGFLTFTFMPGLALLYLLRAESEDFLETLLLSIGLSLAFLIAIGLAINFIYPVFGYSTPLSIASLIISTGGATTLLCIGSYFSNRGKPMPGIHAFLWPADKLVWPLILSIILPLLSILGTQVMGAYGDNRLLLTLFFLIPAYIVFLVLLRERLVTGTYPVAIGMISLAVLLAWGLTSDYLMGGDIYVEFQTVRIILGNGYWGNAEPPTPVNMSLGISLLPVIYSRLLSISAVYTFKVVVLLLTSVVPVTIYVITRRLLGSLYAFLTSCFFMVQIPFINLLPRQGRVDIALIFFSLSLLVLLKPTSKILSSRVLFLVFALTLTISYYVTPLLLLLMLFALFIASPLVKTPERQGSITLISYVVLCSFVLVLWWGQSQYGALPSYVGIAADMIRWLGNPFAFNVEGTWVAGLYQFSGGYLRIVRVILQYVVNALLGIGVLYIIFKRKQLKTDLDNVLIMVISLFLLVLYLIAPFLSRYYGGDRLFIQLLVILSPAFILGCLALSLGKKRVATIMAVVLLSFQFLISTFTIDQLSGVPSSIVLNGEGPNHDTNYVYYSEVTAAQWLYDHSGDELNVEIDFNPKPGTGWMFEFTGYQAADKKVNVRSGAFTGEEHEADGYLFLRRANVVSGRVYNPLEDIPWELGGREPLSQYDSMLSSRNKVYSNGSAEIYR